MSPAARIARVLVGVDFDDASASALQMAAVLATAWDADLTVLHSALPEAPVYFTADQIDALEAERAQSRARTAGQLRAFAAQHVERTVSVIVDEGAPAEALLRTAAALDLVVVGTHRRHGAGRWWLGSVAEAVVRRSPRPVLVVPAGAVVPATPLAILAVGDTMAGADAWIAALTDTFGASVVRSADIHHCAPDRLQDADLVVLAMTAADTHARLGHFVQVLKECLHPVLFVPPADRALERSSS